MSFIKKPLGVNMFKILLMSLFLFISNTCYASSIYVVVHSAAGNGADLQARVVAKHLPKHLPPNTSVGVINMPGAGGLTMANWLYNVADPNTNIAFLNVNSDVILDGILKDPSVKYDIVDQVIVAADVFVLPSREDGWGVVLNEATSLGIPVITTNVFEFSELINNGNSCCP
jgi:glycosyltransferase involved in cell wall biosynthesis